MDNNKQQCFNCGYFYQSYSTYYSEDFATYWSPSPVFSVRWCFHCKKVTTYKQAKAFGLFKVPAVVPDKIMSLEEFALSPQGKQKDYESGTVIAQFLRLIWLCILKNQKQENNIIYEQYLTVELALNILSPEIVAYMLQILMNYKLLVDTPREIQEGSYFSELGGTGSYDEHWVMFCLNKCKNHPNTQRVMFLIEESKSYK